MVKHTPGPWIVQENGGPEDGYNVLDARDRYIAFVDTSGEMISDEQAHANARLIAEAPAMRAALVTLVDERDRAALADDPAYLMIDRAIEAARALLARIDGDDLADTVDPYHRL